MLIIEFITGSGTHSVNSQPVLRKSVKETVEELGYKYTKSKVSIFVYIPIEWIKFDNKLNSLIFIIY